MYNTMWFVVYKYGHYILESIIAIGACLGSLLIALNQGLEVYGFLCFILSSIASLAMIVGTKVPKSIIFTNVWFTLVNIIGIYTHI